MADELLELNRFRADLPPVDEAAMARARATLVHTATSVPVRRRRSPARIAATATVAAAAVAAFLLVPSMSDNAPTASAVTFNGDGSVTIQLTDVTDMSTANEMLEQAGIHAELVSLEPSTCAPGVEPAPSLPEPDGLVLDQPRNEQNILTFRPTDIPAGARLVIFATMGTIMHDASGEVVPIVVMTGQLYSENSGTCLARDFDSYILLETPGVR
jgi:hypothetical protein